MYLYKQDILGAVFTDHSAAMRRICSERLIPLEHIKTKALGQKILSLDVDEYGHKYCISYQDGLTITSGGGLRPTYQSDATTNHDFYTQNGLPAPVRQEVIRHPAEIFKLLSSGGIFSMIGATEIISRKTVWQGIVDDYRDTEVDEIVLGFIDPNGQTKQKTVYQAYAQYGSGEDADDDTRCFDTLIAAKTDAR